MADLLVISEDGALVPGLTDPWLSIFFDAANSAVSRLAPCLTADNADSGRRAEAKLIVLRAIDRVRNTVDFAKAQSAGPFSVTYVTGGRGVLDKADRTALAGLCETPPVGGARGAFPVHDDYSYLFARPGRRGWC